MMYKVVEGCGTKKIVCNAELADIVCRDAVVAIFSDVV